MTSTIYSIRPSLLLNKAEDLMFVVSYPHSAFHSYLKLFKMKYSSDGLGCYHKTCDDTELTQS